MFSNLALGLALFLLDLLPVADRDIVIKLLAGAKITIYMLTDKDRLQCCKAEYHARGEETVDDGQANLG